MSETMKEALDALRTCVTQAEIEISRCTEEALDRLRAKTGVSPDSVTISMIDVTDIGDAMPRHAVGRVCLGLQL